MKLEEICIRRIYAIISNAILLLLNIFFLLKNSMTKINLVLSLGTILSLIFNFFDICGLPFCLKVKKVYKKKNYSLKEKAKREKEIMSARVILYQGLETGDDEEKQLLLDIQDYNKKLQKFNK